MRNLVQGTVLFSRYKIIDLIGSGGSSKVFLAENVRTGSLVAVKSVGKNDGHINLIAEKDMLKELRHSSIPIIVDICEDEDGTYLIEEYVEGKPLGSLKRQLDEAVVKDIMVQLCDVLNYLHTACGEPIIYRDLKPDNIIMMNNGRIKLIDFGIAVRNSEMKDSSAKHYGTRGYAAPEQLSYSKSDERTDIYSLGVCIYYLMTGKNLSSPPYRLLPIREVNPDISQEFAVIIGKCIETLPGKRYQKVQQIMADVHNIGKSQDGEGDYQIFKEHGNRIVTCAGLRHGIGTTHLVFMIAMYYRKLNKSVAVVEWQRRDDLIKTASLYNEVLEGRHHFEFRGVDWYFYTKGCDYSKVITEDYDMIVIDGGTLEELEVRGCYELTDDLMVVCGSKDWEIDYFEETIYTNLNKHTTYLFNFTSDHTYNHINKEMPGIACYQLPYNPEAYEPEEETCLLFGRMFSESMVAAPEKERGKFYEIWNGIWQRPKHNQERQK